MELKRLGPLIAYTTTIGIAIIIGLGVYIEYAAGPVGLHQADTPSSTSIIGGDKDIHGCIGSAGYSWCEAKQKCLRTWEEKCERLIPTQDEQSILCPPGTIGIGPLDGSIGRCLSLVPEGDKVDCGKYELSWWRASSTPGAPAVMTGKIAPGIFGGEGYSYFIWSHVSHLRIQNKDESVSTYGIFDLLNSSTIERFKKIPVQTQVHPPALWCSLDNSGAWGAVYANTSADPPQPQVESIARMRFDPPGIETYDFDADSAIFNRHREVFAFARFNAWSALHEEKAGDIKIGLYEPLHDRERILIAYPSSTVKKVSLEGDWFPSRPDPDLRWVDSSTIEYFDYNIQATTTFVVFP